MLKQDGQLRNIEHICAEVKERERRIGIFASLTSPSCYVNKTSPHECNVPRRKSVAVTMKTLYSDFVVREMCAFHNHGEPLQLNRANYSVESENESTTKVNCACEEAQMQTSTNATSMKRERCGVVDEMQSIKDVMDDCEVNESVDVINGKSKSNTDNSSSAKRVKSECHDETSHLVSQHMKGEDDNDEFINNVKQTLVPLLSETDLERVVEFVSINCNYNRSKANAQSSRTITNNSTSVGSSSSNIVLEDTVNFDKAMRTKVHTAIKSCMRRQFISSTVNNKICITVANAAMRREEERRSRPIRTRSFTHFTLYKENLDSAQVFRGLARLLHVRTRQFSYCGTKDKRAVTLQRVAIQDFAPNRLSTIINRQRMSPHGTVRVGDFTIERSALRLGDAMGNHFTIVLRCLPAANATITPSDDGGSGGDNSSIININTDNDSQVNQPNVTQLKETEALLARSGVINYYGPQRFGTTSILTSDIGVALLRGDYHQALRLIFASRACIVPDMEEVVNMVASRDYVSALAHTPHYCLQERDMLRYLIDQPNDLQGAFRVLPRTLAMLYFHAVQSLVWNTIASQRILRHYGESHEVETIECITDEVKETWREENAATNLRNSKENKISSEVRANVEVGDLVLESVYVKRTGCHARKSLEESKTSSSNKELLWVNNEKNKCDDECCTDVIVESNALNADTEYNQENLSTETNSEVTATEDDDDMSEGNGDKCKLPAVHRLTAHDDLTLFTLNDVLLPLPGPDLDLQYPTSAGCTYTDYKEIMRNFGVLTSLLNVHDDASGSCNSEIKNHSSSNCTNNNKDLVNNNALVKTFHFHGAYRSLYVTPQNIEIYLDSVNGWRTPVIHTDLELLNATGADTENKQVNQRPCTNTAETIVNANVNVNDKEVSGANDDTMDDKSSKNNGDKKNVDVIVCKFSLPAGSYATSVLREVAIVCPDNQHVTAVKQTL